jgi:hypothetical protein
MNGGDILLVGLVLMVGCLAFIFGVIYLFFSMFAMAGRGLMAIVWPRRRSHGCNGTTCRVRACPNPKCQEVERRAARFCGHCGTKLEPQA